jgi:3',5'-cyclic AMP phosphodiesterase CpdA
MDTYNVNDYASLVKKDGEAFRILQLADTQLENNEAKIQTTFDIITAAVKDNHPDMLVLTGDNVSGSKNNVLGLRLIRFLDTFEIPYAMVMGNHDGEGKYNNEQMGEIYASGNYSLFTDGPGSIHGTGNYGVNIINKNNEVIYALIMIDSNRYRIGGYDYIYEDQIAWYEWMIKGVSFSAPRAPGTTVKSLAFFHIPLPEIDTIREKMIARNPAEAADAIREDPCPPKKNTGMFQKMKELGSTQYMFFGHDHVNMLDYEYEGIHFVYGLKTGPCSYYNDDRLGTTLITIEDDLTVTVEFKHGNSR